MAMKNLLEELESEKCNAEDLCGGDFRSEDTAVVRLDRIRNAVASAREELKRSFCKCQPPLFELLNKSYKGCKSCSYCREIDLVLREK